MAAQTSRRETTEGREPPDKSELLSKRRRGLGTKDTWIAIDELRSKEWNDPMFIRGPRKGGKASKRRWPAGEGRKEFYAKVGSFGLTGKRFKK